MTRTRFLNRELSTLDYLERLLALAANDDQPTLEQAKFLAIIGRNLDEFVQTRVARIAAATRDTGGEHTRDCLLAREEMRIILLRTRDLVSRQTRIFEDRVRPRLRASGVDIVDWRDLNAGEQEQLTRTFQKRFLSVMPPPVLCSDPAFPSIADLLLNILVEGRDPAQQQTRVLGRVQVPAVVPRFVKLRDGHRFALVEQVIAANLDQLVPGLEIEACHTFRAMRGGNVLLEPDESSEFVDLVESTLRRRRTNTVVRLEVASTMPEDACSTLVRALRVTRRDLDAIDGLLALRDLWSFTDIRRPTLKAKKRHGVTPPQLHPPVDFFAVLDQAEVLVHHPYDGFAASVEAFVRQAASDADVITIKQTIYRTSEVGEAPIVHSLIRAARAGKDVVAVIELRARGDEQANIGWARALTQEGVHVVYGSTELKTHAKIVLVARRKGSGVQRYCHIGTGNYNPETATVYEDVGLLSADPQLTDDVEELFNRLAGASPGRAYRKILVAPQTLRSQLLDLIHREAEAPDGRIVIKINNLVDREIIGALYAASSAGADIDVIVRSICCLRAGVPGLSERIRVRSIVGRYLEHSRIFRFGSDARGPRYYLGSADLMSRNLDRRIECLTPVLGADLKHRLGEILAVELADDVLAWRLVGDRWLKVPTTNGVDSHERLHELADARVLGAPRVGGWTARHRARSVAPNVPA